jgi:hypothetical protein
VSWPSSGPHSCSLPAGDHRPGCALDLRPRREGRSVLIPRCDP